MQQPAVSEEYIAFVYANDIWIVLRQGEAARRITFSEGTEISPRFSPEGAIIAFTGQYDDNTDVEWGVDNIGVAPDIEVEMTPSRVIEGHDPQFERAMEEALRMLEQNPVKHTPRPATIDRAE